MMNREPLFRRINNSLLDMQASTSQTFEQHFLTFARLLADSSLQSLNQQLVADLDVEQFLDESSKTSRRHGRVQRGLSGRWTPTKSLG